MTETMRTDLNCHACNKNFIAQLDLGVDGNHIIVCPWCGHEHCRTVDKGVVTENRWTSRNWQNGPRIEVDPSHVWKCDVEPILTTSAAAFLREKWLDRLEPQS